MDILLVVVHEGAAVAKTAEVDSGLVDIDAGGRVVSFEIHGASAIIEHASDLLTRRDLPAALADEVRRYVTAAQLQIERAESAEPAAR